MPVSVYLKVLGATFLVLGMFLVFFYLLRRGRLRLSAGSGEIEIREIRPLDFKNRLVLVRVRGSLLLLGLSEKAISFLKEWPDEET
ncbi:flagellar biosynthetic protein FliO [Thermosulfurimonas sp. F29]|uniref:flagellar biosynthetic protein FliO n=1 Tax=Thermosulfurimonas sp. F29 TaxID=2867247 RepID=UPI001C836731|nr:flagellar biosynthetic protein FliO [Thermosulfurimonas sp. F29]MBX6423607.1 flagellar biosynthetic protein FliO [Thermosulfurimonas sp. F29]